MAKLGRKPTYQSKDEWAVVISLRVPRDVEKQLREYAARHRQSVTEVILDGIRMRLETPADPRDIILSDDNTVIRELQEMIRAEVQAEIGKLNNFMGSAMDALKLSPTSEAPAPQPTTQPAIPLALEPAPRTAHPVAMPQAAEPPAEPVPVLSYDSNTVLQDDAGQTDIPPYDASKYVLGKLCPRGHNYHGTGQSLRYCKRHVCLECDAEGARERRKAKRQGQPAGH